MGTETRHCKAIPGGDADFPAEGVRRLADAVGLALHVVTAAGWANHAGAAERAFGFVRSRQRADGGFLYFSRGDYGVLTDRNEYPRYLAMSLYHLAEFARPVRAA